MKVCAKCNVHIWRGTLCNECRKERDTKKNKLNWAANKKKNWLVNERGNTCEVCKANAPLIVHHLISLVDGGTNDDSNLQLVCKGCHDSYHQKRQRIDWSKQ